ncbi:hypothetical protein MtrunA17_Chr4g0049661 [Medicago truncatula]|uniref:Uncharacterized protein n=1 Tax=Medicago truncatula TaxID=3880 RepID=A0A396IFX4_MEDTR|nr:hypothetical protein MtrunA17_Chr4g0049661 [Medicago truncatula]
MSFSKASVPFSFIYISACIKKLSFSKNHFFQELFNPHVTMCGFRKRLSLL